ncbi:hypothetical protein AFCDBAGC_4686 [Methylobacterium cerastii]|uniref:Uncharacterized protein n=1 Tax=Methylobacterium cerastii TaxID=932741 RepID=A0ABQ4QNM7_9HYPH|nr:hypothetical protein [Methylobacterium cerastii]GJD46802.1 hypothetical protein AFCDBAGC_4686 [Methylobacterium cerastii]
MTTVAEQVELAAYGFECAAGSRDPGPAFAMAMRAACRGAVTGVLPAEDYRRLAPLVDAAERSLAAANPMLVPSIEDQASNSDCLDDLLRFWAEPADARTQWHPDFLRGLVALILQLASRVEDASLEAIAVRGVRHRPTLSVERASAPRSETTSEMIDADLSCPQTRH